MEGFGLSGLLFGNINEEGKLENEDLFDEELVKALSKKEVASQIGLNLDFVAREDTIVQEDAINRHGNNQGSKATIVTSTIKGSIDFSMIDEVAPDETEAELEATQTPQSYKVDNSTTTTTTTTTSTIVLKEDTPSSADNVLPFASSINTEDSSRLFTKSHYLIKNGRVLKFSNFFSSKPAQIEGKYRNRRLGLKKKKAKLRHVTYLEDQVEIFHSSSNNNNNNSSSNINVKQPLGLLQQILASAIVGVKGKKMSSRQKAIEESFELRSSSSFPTVSEKEMDNNNNNKTQQSVVSSHHQTQSSTNDIPFQNVELFYPINLVEWEDNIVYDTVKSTQAFTPRNIYLYAGVPLLSHSGPASRTGSGSGGASRPTTPFMPSSMTTTNTAVYHQTMRQTLPLHSSLTTFNASSSSMNSLHQQRSLSTSNPSSRTSTPMLHVIAPRSLAGRIINNELLSGSWEEQIIWDDTRLPDTFPSIHLQLPLADPQLIFEAIDTSNLTERLLKTEKLIQKRLRKLRHGLTHDGKSLVLTKFEKPVNDRFNISNDKQYETGISSSSNSSNKGGVSGNNRVRLGTTGATGRGMISSSRLGVQHAVPALKLLMPCYKTFWTKTELREWHRQKLDTIPVVSKSVMFEKLIKTKDSGPGRRTAASIIGSAKKMSLRDRLGEFVLLEYCEEFPLLTMNAGMATFLLHFHRKQNPKDVPILTDLPYGVARILEPNETSPFWIFGEVRPGQTLPAIQNNLFRAPIFDHKPAVTDFLALKNNVKGKGQSKWFIRELPAQISLIGQVFPTMEVFGPHSRRHNQFCRARIQAFAYRLFRKDAKAHQNEVDFLPRLKISRIMTAFPQFSEGSLRKWLKEYADSVRTGSDSGTWRLRKDAPVLSEDDIRALVTPEMICQYESMLAGQQRLNDSGFMEASQVIAGDELDDVLLDDDEGKGGTSGGGNNGKETSNEEGGEDKLAPWTLSTNFINATVGKCNLQLHGTGDPSGRGEAFSFIKAPLKPTAKFGNSSSGAANNSQSSNTTTLNFASTTMTGHSTMVKPNTSIPLANPGPPQLKLSNEQMAYRQEIVRIWDAQIKALSNPNAPEESAAYLNDFSIFEDKVVGTDVIDNSGIAAIIGNDDDVMSIGSRSSKVGGAGSKTLVIRRIGLDPITGLEVEQSESISDPRVISAYINQRRVWERKKKRRAIAAAASAARVKKIKPEGSSTGGASSSSTKISTPRPRSESAPKKPKKEVFVKCGTCGQIGHMRTNKICPRYSEYEKEEEARKAEANSYAMPLKISINMNAISNNIKSMANSDLASATTTTIMSSSSATNTTITMGAGANSMSHSQSQSHSPSLLILPLSTPKPIKKKKGFDIETLEPAQKQAMLQLSESFAKIINELMNSTKAWPFNKPVSKTNYPHYYRIIAKPLDFSTIRSRIKRHYYPRIAMLVNDLRLVRDNCLQFNGLDHPFSQTIAELVATVEEQLSSSELTDLEKQIHGDCLTIDNIDNKSTIEEAIGSSSSSGTRVIITDEVEDEQQEVHID